MQFHIVPKDENLAVLAQPCKRGRAQFLPSQALGKGTTSDQPPLSESEITRLEEDLVQVRQGLGL